MANNIPFTRATVTGREIAYLQQVIEGGHLSGDGPFSAKCTQWFERNCKVIKALLTPSCTAALELAAMLIDLGPGDEVIMPSFTFVSTANAVVLRGAIPVFVDIRPDTLNIDESKIEAAISSRTRAIIPVHYAGVACDMKRICKIADEYGLVVIEDAAQAVGSSLDGRALGSWGHFGTFSFHQTKNICAGEAGVLCVNEQRFVERAEILREKGTNRKKFLRGEVDKYTWVDIGSSFLPSELAAAFLFAQLESANEITNHRLNLYGQYMKELTSLEQAGYISLPRIQGGSSHNAHIFYLVCRNSNERTDLQVFLKSVGIQAATHFVPLHNAPAGLRFGKASGILSETESVADRILRLPLFHQMTSDDVRRITFEVLAFYKHG